LVVKLFEKGVTSTIAHCLKDKGVIKAKTIESEVL
jgi:hypothetical protein